MPAHDASSPLEASECRLREDGLKDGGHELTHEAPGGRSGQAAARRGESPSSSMSGSSSRMINRWASR